MDIDSPPGVLLRLLAVLGLVLANGFFVAAEFSLVSIRRTRVEELISQGNRMAAFVKRAIQDPDRFIAATQLGITIASLGLGWIGEPALARLIEPLFGFLPTNWSTVATHGVAVAVAFGLITLLHVVLGELAPKSVALQYPDATALWIARPTLWFENLFRPIIWFLNGTGNLVLRLFGLRPPTGIQKVHSVEELRLLVTESQKGGALEAVEREMIHRIFEFGERGVQEVMIPHPEIVAIEQESSVDDLLRLFSQHSHARFPVYSGNLDNIVGYVVMKDILRALAADPASRERRVKDLVRQTIFTPETRPIGELFAEMRKKQAQMAIVIDEHGGTAGIVTLEELVEEIVGRVSDELVKQRPAVERLDEKTVVVDAQMRIDEANVELALALPEREEYDTIAGFILWHLRRIPKVGEEMRYDNLRITVKELDGPRIERVAITRG
ncbi:MAG: HlyC/CorC family transporter [Chloroflexi bacterium]|nr:HlyC/CorC family transporter [Chloroflexota bacterium]